MQFQNTNQNASQSCPTSMSFLSLSFISISTSSVNKIKEHLEHNNLNDNYENDNSSHSIIKFKLHSKRKGKVVRV